MKDAQDGDGQDSNVKIIAKNNTAFIYARLRSQFALLIPFFLDGQGHSQDLVKGGSRRSFMANVFVKGLAQHTGMLLKVAL